ncbi:MAG: methyltransferase domain-containing protein [Spirochaetaceae bacterium]|nr:MAG: methyltransferase domain-containing protein [Spirochaetaceae bacterium]
MIINQSSFENNNRPTLRQLHCTTSGGLEDVTAAEISRLCHGLQQTEPQIEQQPWGISGHVICRVAADGSGPSALFSDGYRRLRSIYYAIEHIAEFSIDPSLGADQIATALAAIEIPALRRATSFRVSSVRSGLHEFASPDVERAAGAQLQRDYRLEVDLENFDVNVRIDIVDQRVLVGLQLNQSRLDRRYLRTYRPRVSLRPAIAYAMLTLADLADDAATVVDPFCGSGTILLEAASIFPQARVLGFDHDREAVDGARHNSAQNALQHRIAVQYADARGIHQLIEPRSVDAIVTNPPFGIRLARRTDFRSLYGRFLESAWQVLKPAGKLVILVGKRRSAFNQVVQETGRWRYLGVRIIDIAGVYPGLFVMQKRAQ